MLSHLSKLGVDGMTNKMLGFCQTATNQSKTRTSQDGPGFFVAIILIYCDLSPKLRGGVWHQA